MESDMSDFFECGQCKTISVHSSTSDPRICPFCGFPDMKKMAIQIEVPPVELIANDQLSKNEIENLFFNFIKPVRFCSQGLNVTALMRNTRRIYQPGWLVDSTVKGNWTATFGYNYQVESSREIFENNQWISKKIEETRVDWEPRSGLIDRNYQNILINSFRRQDWLTKVLGKFDYSPPLKFSNSEKVESMILPDVTPSKGWQDAQTKFELLIQNECKKAAGAQHVKAFASHIDYSSVNWTLILAPYYQSHYFDEKGNPHTVWINPQTKKISGERISSQKKGNKWGFIFLTGAIFLLILGIIFASISQNNQLFQLFSVFSIIAFLLLLIFSGYSFIYPYQYNKKSQAFRFENFYKRSK